MREMLRDMWAAHGGTIDGARASISARELEKLLEGLVGKTRGRRAGRDATKVDLEAAAARVMATLAAWGPTIVPHLIDSDDNDGEFLRRMIRRPVLEAAMRREADSIKKLRGEGHKVGWAGTPK